MNKESFNGLALMNINKCENISEKEVIDVFEGKALR